MNMNKVLFIDDEKFILDTIQRKLKNTDIEGFYAKDGNVGLHIMEQENISVVFTDLIMPSINGLHVVEEVYKRNPNAVIVVLSGNTQSSAITKTMNSHMVYRYLLKPWKLDEEAIGFIRHCLELAEEREGHNGEQLMIDADILNKVFPYNEWVLTDIDDHIIKSNLEKSESFNVISEQPYVIVDSSMGRLKLYSVID